MTLDGLLVLGMAAAFAVLLAAPLIPAVYRDRPHPEENPR